MLSCKSHRLVVLLVYLLVISFVATGSNSKEAIFLSADKLHFQGRCLLKKVASPDGNVTIVPSGGSKQIPDSRRETSQAAVRRQNHPVGSRVERPVRHPRLPPRTARPPYSLPPASREGPPVAPVLPVRRRPGSPPGNRRGRPVCHPRLPPGTARPPRHPPYALPPAPRGGPSVAPVRPFRRHPGSPPGNRRGRPVRYPRLPPGKARPPRSTVPPGSRKGPAVAPVLPFRRHPGGPPGNRRGRPVRHASLPPASNEGHHGAP